MTIKQYGGVFGRNPTFNDVTIEGQLTFDGDIDIDSDLKVDGDLEVTGTGTIGNMTLSGSTIDVDPDGTSGYTQSRLILEASGVASRGAGTFTHNDVSDIEWFQGMAYDSSGSWAACSQSTAAHNDSTANFSNAKFSVAAAGDATVHSGNLVIGTSGNGIDFSATAGTGTSELLDDYEEGAFTPNYTAATGGDLGGTQSRQGYYTKVGNKVTIQLYLFINTIDVTGKSGSVTVTGLPFTGSLGGNATGVIVTTESTGSYGAFTNSPRTAKLSGTGDSLTLLKEISSNVEQPLQVTDFATGAGNRNIIRCSFTYII